MEHSKRDATVLAVPVTWADLASTCFAVESLFSSCTVQPNHFALERFPCVWSSDSSRMCPVCPTLPRCSTTFLFAVPSLEGRCFRFPRLKKSSDILALGGMRIYKSRWLSPRCLDVAMWQGKTGWKMKWSLLSGSSLSTVLELLASPS